MKESIGYTLTLNIAIVFIVIIFTFLSNIVVYYKTYKVSNIITSTIEKYEGFNDLAYNEIEDKLVSIGYSRSKVKCVNSNDIPIIIQGYGCVNILSSENLYSDYFKYLSTGLNMGAGMDSLHNATNQDTYKTYNSGYCVYKCPYTKVTSYPEKNHESLQNHEYFYIVKTNMFAEIPIINSIFNYSVYTDTNIMYDFETAVTH